MDTTSLFMRAGKAVVLLPHDEPWEILLESLGQCSPDFMSDRNQTPLQDRESL